MIAGTQGGKTGFGPDWLARAIARGGSGDYLGVTATFDLFKLKMLPALQLVFEDILGIGRYWAGDRLFEIRNPVTRRFEARKATDQMWARVILRSADAVGGLEAATAKAAWADEADQPRFGGEAWKAMKRRLAIHQGPVLITTTLYGLGWLKQQVYDRAMENGAQVVTEFPHGALLTVTDHPGRGWDDIRLVQYDSIINPAFPLDEYLDAQSTMPDDEFAMFWRGLYAALRSLIYNCFDAKIHKVRHFEPPPHWPRCVGIDPLGEYIAAVWLAFDPDKGQLHLYREYYEPFGETTPGHAKACLHESRFERIQLWVGGSPSERQPRADWAGGGIPLQEPPFKDVWVGIDRVYALIKMGQLLIHDNCPITLSQIGTYQRKKDARTGELTEHILNKDRYHLLDALRYIIAYLTEPREQREVLDWAEAVSLGPRL